MIPSPPHIYDQIIIGAGPSGLSLAHILSINENNNFLLFDLGKKLENRFRYDSSDCWQGIGGAGLFSDGKFSFFPSGTKIWTLQNKEILKNSYHHLQKIFADHFGRIVPEFPDKNGFEFDLEGDQFCLKKYGSFYMGLEERVKLIKMLQKDIEGKIKEQCEVIKLQWEDKNEYFQIKIKNGVLNWEEEVYYARKIILGGGKFFPIKMFEMLQTNDKVFRRFEFGIRIEGKNDEFKGLFDNKDKQLKEKEGYVQHDNLSLSSDGNTNGKGDTKQNDEPFLNKNKNNEAQTKNLIDPKWICKSKEEDNVQFRTFCMCVDGETIECDFNGLKTFSGRSDCDPTDRTNFGLNIVVYDEKKIDFTKILNNKTTFTVPLEEITAQQSIDNIEERILENFYGINGSHLLISGVKALIKQFNLNEGKILVKGPTIEGIGYYPNIDENLRLKNNKNIFIIGDASGIFRGIIPAILSGFYVGNLISNTKN